MSGYILHKGAKVQCPHQGSARPDQTDTRVRLAGQAIMTVTLMYTVEGCGLNGTSSPPCTTATWTRGAARVFAGGLAVAITTGQSLCAPSGASLDPLLFQKRVTAT